MRDRRLLSQTDMPLAHTCICTVPITNHGHHDDETPSSTGEQVPDHDSDVVYDGDDQLLYEGKVANTARAELAALYFIGDDSSAIAALCRICGRLTSPAVLRSKCALYSQLLSIRC